MYTQNTDSHEQPFESKAKKQCMLRNDTLVYVEICGYATKSIAQHDFRHKTNGTRNVVISNVFLWVL